MMVTILIVPWLADTFGRKWNVLINQVLFMAAVLGVMLGHSLEGLYACMFVCGATFAGRVIVAINYLLEFMVVSNKEFVIFLKLAIGSAIVMIYTLIIQFGTRHWLQVAWAFLALDLVGTVYIALLVPESPLYLFGRGDFEEARYVLTEIALFNGV